MQPMMPQMMMPQQQVPQNSHASHLPISYNDPFASASNSKSNTPRSVSQNNSVAHNNAVEMSHCNTQQFLTKAHQQMAQSTSFNNEPHQFATNQNVYNVFTHFSK